MNARLKVSLSAVAYNYRKLQQSASGKVAAVVKANAYGLGAAAISLQLRRDGCDEFFVATWEEGVSLRQHLPDATIYVLEGASKEAIPALMHADLRPVLNTHAQLAAWACTKAPAAVHIDTGMERLGFSASSNLSALWQSSFPVCLLITHLARGDEPGQEWILLQINRIQPLFESLKVHFPAMRLSVCNSAGLLQGVGPEDVGRAGIALYGGNPFTKEPNPMISVLTFEGRVLQVRSVPANTPVGYGGTFVTRRRTRLATIGVGYADGVPRCLSNRGSVALNGSVCAMRGRVSMDCLTVDASGVNVKEGDWAELIGPTLSINAIANKALTVPYEILTGIGSRVSRVYLNG